MAKSRAKTIRVYDFTCDQCGRSTRFEQEGPVERANPLKEPIDAPLPYGSDPIDRAWRTITLKPMAGGGRDRHERIGFVCSDECASAWAAWNAVIEPEEPESNEEATDA